MTKYTKTVSFALAGILVALALFWGCPNTRDRQSESSGITNAETANAGVKAEIGQALRLNKQMEPHVDHDGKPLVVAQKHTLEAADTAADDEAAANREIREENVRLERERDNAVMSEKSLRTFWPVAAVLWLYKWIVRTIIGWSIVCLVILVLKWGDPLKATTGLIGAIVKVVTFVIGQIPFTYTFALIGKWLGKKRMAKKKTTLLATATGTDTGGLSPGRHEPTT